MSMYVCTIMEGGVWLAWQNSTYVYIRVAYTLTYESLIHLRMSRMAELLPSALSLSLSCSCSSILCSSPILSPSSLLSTFDQHYYKLWWPKLLIAKLSLPASKGWVALSSLVCLSFVRSSVPHRDISTVWCFRPYKPYIFYKAIGPSISELILSSVSYTNTKIHIHKYTNTACDNVPERPNM